MGPGAGGCFRWPYVNPADDTMVALSGDMSGSYISADSGKFFHQYNFYGGANTWAFDPSNKDVIYACSPSGGLYQSTDRGDHFISLLPPEGKRGYTSQLEYGGGVYSLVGGPVGTQAAAVDPTNSEILYALCNNDVYKSTNVMGDATFTKLNLALPEGVTFTGRTISGYDRQYHFITNMWIDPSSPADARDIYIATNYRIYKITDNSASSKPTEELWAGDNLNFLLDMSFAHNPKDKSTHAYFILRGMQILDGATNATSKKLGINTVNLLYRVKNLADLGDPAKWEDISEDIPRDGRTNLAFNYVSAASQTDVYLSILGPSAGGGAWGAIATFDGGITWDWNFRIAGFFPENFGGHGWLEIKHGPGWASDNYGFYAAGSTCIIANMGTVYGTFDKGKKWTQLATQNYGNSFFGTTGLCIINGECIDIDPNFPDNILVGYADVGAMHSNDGGHTWRSATGGVPGSWSNTMYHSDYDPDNPGVVWGAWTGQHDLPSLPNAISPTGRYTTYTGGICVSYNSGYSWRESSKGIERTRFIATDVIVDRSSDPDNRTLYACAMGGWEFASQHGVYRSVDGGQNWTPFEDGISGPGTSRLRCWRFYRSEKDNRIYLMLATNGWSYYNNQMVEGAVFYLDPGDTQWTRADWKIRNGAVNVYNEITIDPNDPDTIFVVGRGQVVNNKVHYSGVFKSTNGGATWDEVVDNTIVCSSVRIDPRNSNHVYVTQLNGFILVSYEGGNKGTWITSREYVNFMSPKVAIPDWRTDDPEKMFIVTRGGGVFYGPVPPQGGYKD